MPEFSIAMRDGAKLVRVECGRSKVFVYVHVHGVYAPMNALTEFAQGYIEAMFFTADFDGESCGDYGFHDIDEESLRKIVSECDDFYRENEKDISQGFIPLKGHPGVSAELRGGADYWYTRNWHGVGYWEGDRWTRGEGLRLSEAASLADRRDVYVGDDNKVHYC